MKPYSGKKDAPKQYIFQNDSSTPLLVAVTVILLVSLVAFAMTKSVLLPLILVSILIGILVFFVRNIFTTVTVNSEAIIVSNKWKHKVIKWDIVESVATVNIDDITRYQVKTLFSAIILPLYGSKSDFEESIQRFGHLIIENDTYPLLFKRWKREGHDYKVDTLSDRLTNPMYKIPNLQGKAIAYVLAILCVFMVIFVLFAYVNGTFN